MDLCSHTVVSSVLLYVPASHVVHAESSADVEPSLYPLPAGQSTMDLTSHAVASSVSLYMPASHAVQASHRRTWFHRCSRDLRRRLQWTWTSSLCCRARQHTFQRHTRCKRPLWNPFDCPVQTCPRHTEFQCRCSGLLCPCMCPRDSRRRMRHPLWQTCQQRTCCCKPAPRRRRCQGTDLEGMCCPCTVNCRC